MPHGWSNTQCTKTPKGMSYILLQISEVDLSLQLGVLYKDGTKESIPLPHKVSDILTMKKGQAKRLKGSTLGRKEFPAHTHTLIFTNAVGVRCYCEFYRVSFIVTAERAREKMGKNKKEKAKRKTRA